ncbi:RNA methyltransferase, TrmH family, group 3 [Luminiphilus syltensis NOR5-1B]|uniref:23S rRNA (guanosine-2'-O-)-methyltransferase RlmB n=1 Tax=Luminiphilus syltensis NOR5-1B TaxID=565045 RepID=B8KW93_9GAMM|nr:23S rRNA (guanosine(2251)-2'-O)-methyltransferase RlmB [Luminiphilus syltensis]EED35670.1 RNA methyltransferase, TrmH family, group 3 [Luminiphilus syltensis NOR5-1B]
MSERIFGLHAVESALKHRPEALLRVMLQKGRDDKRMRELETLARNQGVTIERRPRTELDRLVDGRHQGVVAEIEQGADGPPLDEAGLMQRVAETSTPLLLVLDGVTDPHNLGACLRSADAAGVTAVIVPKNNSADLTPAVRKVACGAAEAVPFVRVTNLVRTLAALQAEGVWVVGTTGDAEQSLYAQDFAGPIALVMGAEGQGMRRLTQEQCDFLVYLPMAGEVSSLNVSVATGVCLFEAVRQRSVGTSAVD